MDPRPKSVAAGFVAGGADEFVLCSEDRFFPPEFLRRVVAERLGMTADEMPAGHCVALSRPKELAEELLGYLVTSYS